MSANGYERGLIGGDTELENVRTGWTRDMFHLARAERFRRVADHVAMIINRQRESRWSELVLGQGSSAESSEYRGSHCCGWYAENKYNFSKKSKSVVQLWYAQKLLQCEC